MSSMPVQATAISPGRGDGSARRTSRAREEPKPWRPSWALTGAPARRRRAAVPVTVTRRGGGRPFGRVHDSFFKTARTKGEVPSAFCPFAPVECVLVAKVRASGSVGVGREMTTG